MELDEYTKSAIRTESTIDSITISKQDLIEIVRVYVDAANILDQYKKSIFYGREIDSAKFCLNVAKLRESADKFCKGTIHNPTDTLTINTRVLHSLLGCMTESGELGEALLEALETGQLDLVNVGEEMNDINWYQAIFYDAANMDWGNGLNNNIEKLKARYPEKFTEENAFNRDLGNERKILEKNID